MRFVSIVLALCIATSAFAKDDGQWENADPTIRNWYSGLTQPDNPSASCCGETDAYWCDTIHIRGQKTFCAITDTRDDAPLHRRHIDVGTEFEIPNHKLKWNEGNPTGHAIIFLSKGDYVYCFVQGTGI